MREEIDYKKKYEDTLERANAKIETYNRLGNASAVKSICEIFPELRESEDERMRKDLIDFLNSPFINENITDEKTAPWITWLEKQGKKDSQVILPMFTFDDILALQCCMKEVQKDEELYKQLQSLHDRIHDAYWLEKQDEQMPVWTKEDEKTLFEVITELEYRSCLFQFQPKDYSQAINWLKSIKERMEGE